MKIISNLSEIALSPFQIIVDICSHFKTSYANEIKEIESHLFKPVYPLDTPTDWVNLDDSLGDLAAIRAFELNNLLTSILKKEAISQLELHILLGNQELTEDNIYSLIFLSDTCSYLVINCYTQTEHNHSKLRFVEEIDNAIIYYHQTSHFYQQPIKDSSLHQLNQNRQDILNNNGFVFHQQSEFPPLIKTPNPGSVIDYAWKSLKAGAYRLSCRALEAASNQTNLTVGLKESLFHQLQVIRFLSHQHHLVAETSFPELFETIDEPTTAYLYFIKAFSSTMAGNLPLAETCFAKANINMNMPMSDEDSIYKLNLYALFLVLQKNTDQAFIVEKRLLNYLNAYYPNAVVLNHVIRMNIARLHKRNKQFDLSEKAYQEAYGQLSKSGMTLFDRINFEMDMAILCEAKGENIKALHAWLKVTLYWLACPNPYALAVRPRLVLCQEKVVDTTRPLSPEKVHHFLLNKLELLSQETSVEPIDSVRVEKNISVDPTDRSSSPDEIFNFIPGATCHSGSKTCHFIDDMIIYSYDDQKRNLSKAMSPNEKELHRLTTKLIKKQINFPADSHSVAVETMLDLPLPKSTEEAIALAQLTNCTHCQFKGELIKIDPELTLTLSRDIKISLPQLLCGVEHSDDGTHLHYQRRFLNQVVTDPEIIRWVIRLQNNETIKAESIKGSSVSLLLKALAKKIIILEPANERTVEPPFGHQTQAHEQCIAID
ncbi:MULTISPECIES: hypothetical protein [unclassified Legionella]|uniref:hypothetical protein n=1 Tax=unclassified Legionella TaxID=2622702 RepID=UPI0010551A5F|nr:MULTISPECIES: hypothetical protein [unclassified Legionella]MDI9817796.1 hypothetical protein [Legionella sp. PL877]